MKDQKIDKEIDGNTSNIPENKNIDTPLSLIETGQDVTAPNEVEENGSELLETSFILNDEEKSGIELAIEKINQYIFFSEDKKEILSIIKQYNELCQNIKVCNEEISILKEDILSANKSYDVLKPTFAQIVEDMDWGEKVYFAIPLIDHFKPDRQWDNLWSDVISKAINEDNRENARLYINKNLYSSVFTLPKDVYFYIANDEKISFLDKSVIKATRLLASKMILMFKYLKDASDPLRIALVKIVGYNTMDVPEIVFLPDEKDISEDLSFLNTLLEGENNNLDTAWDIYGKYKKLPSLPEELEIGKYDLFTKNARSMYQEVQYLQNELGSLKKTIYNNALTDLYKLYDTIKKCIVDFQELIENLNDADGDSKVFCKNVIIEMLNRMLTEIELFLKSSLNLKPLILKIGDNYNNINIDYYEVAVAENAPCLELKECIASILDTGFGKYDEEGNLMRVVRPARISVYNSMVIPVQ